MPLRGTERELGRKIAGQILDSSAPKEAREQIEKMWTGVAKAIIDHITTHSDVPVNITINPLTVTTTSVPPVPVQGHVATVAKIT